MLSPRVRTGVYVLEMLNAISTTYYYYYLYFFMSAQFGFGNQQNLWLAAYIGAVYVFASILGGKLGQRFGYLNAVIAGFLQMAILMFAGLFVSELSHHLLLITLSIFGLCLTWPNLEALVSEGLPAPKLQATLGFYNLIWALGGAIAYFTGGAMIEKLGLKSFFLVPSLMLFGQAIIAVYLKSLFQRDAGHVIQATATALAAEPETVAPELRKAFLRMAWLANPFAYVAINTCIAVMPGVAQRLGLSPMLAGFFCSVWFFSRTAAFLIFWWWAGWHYRFRWLLCAYLSLAVTFAVILSSTHLGLLIVAQTLFGLAVGLIYYSSLYYSMHGSDTKGEHGGLHEAAIGAGNSLGPAIGASALALYPRQPNSGAVAVTLLLLVGLAALVLVWQFGKGKTAAARG